MESVSVLVLTYNRDTHLLRQRDSLLPAPGWAECVVTFMDQSEEPWPTLPAGYRTLHLEATGLPLAAARNASAAAARGDVLVFLDVDCLVMPDTILRLSRQCVPGTVVMADPRYLPPGWNPARDGADQAVPHPARAGLIGPTSQWHMFWSLGFAIRAEDYQRLHGFDPAFTGYGAEDTDFAYRCRDAGMHLVGSDAVVLHQAHAVHRPPLQHFDSIIANARTFYNIWGVWPMEGWLDAFQDLGLVRRTSDTLTVLAPPTPQQLAASHLPNARY